MAAAVRLLAQGKIVCVVSGGNLDLDRFGDLAGRRDSPGAPPLLASSYDPRAC